MRRDIGSGRPALVPALASSMPLDYLTEQLQRLSIAGNTKLMNNLTGTGTDARSSNPHAPTLARESRGGVSGSEGERWRPMAEKPKVGCARPTGGPVGQSEDNPRQETAESGREGRTMLQVGKPVPDFVAPAYHRGEFTSVKLSDFLGKWVVLCLYPGDFTFV
jgi:hypothetical protein